ncbi:hypothetical protein [Enterobacter sp.]|uniref:hypothetical protein n=1 Tax=Enterobacter sp. TaxID=42895 RepID=UPI00296F702C|nr:hypothetical protein [Enterobacter sp.]
MALISPVVLMAGAAAGCFSTWWYLRRQSPRKEIKADSGMPSPAFISLDTALAIHDHANSMLFRFLLGELTGALSRHGCALTRDLAQSTELAPDVKNDLAKTLLMQREKFLAPNQSAQAAEETVEYLISTGYAEGWINALLKGCGSQGWYTGPCSTGAGETARHEQEPASHLYPLKQIIIRVQGTTGTLTRDLIRGLERISEDIQITPFPDRGQCETRDGTYGYTGTASPHSTVSYRIVWQHCTSGAGFFPDGYGTDLPAFFEGERGQLSGITGRHMTLIIQGTRHTLSAPMLDCLCQAIRRISAGEFEGAEYGNDFGYAFICERHV